MRVKNWAKVDYVMYACSLTLVNAGLAIMILTWEGGTKGGGNELYTVVVRIECVIPLGNLECVIPLGT